MRHGAVPALAQVLWDQEPGFLHEVFQAWDGHNGKMAASCQPPPPPPKKKSLGGGPPLPKGICGFIAISLPTSSHFIISPSRKRYPELCSSL